MTFWVNTLAIPCYTLLYPVLLTFSLGYFFFFYFFFFFPLEYGKIVSVF